MTMRIYGSHYVTTNTFFSEISKLHCMLTEFIESFENYVVLMGMNMKGKFDKYWGILIK